MSEYLALFEVHEKNKRWFQENYSSLVEEFDRKFVAIHGQAVVDSDEDLDRLIERVESKFALEKVSLEYVTKEKIQLIL